MVVTYLRVYILQIYLATKPNIVRLDSYLMRMIRYVQPSLDTHEHLKKRKKERKKTTPSRAYLSCNCRDIS